MGNMLLYLGDSPILTFTCQSLATAAPVIITGSTIEVHLPLTTQQELVITNTTYPNCIAILNQSTYPGQFTVDLSKVTAQQLANLWVGRNRSVRAKVTLPSGQVANYKSPILDILDPSTVVSS